MLAVMAVVVVFFVVFVVLLLLNVVWTGVDWVNPAAVAEDSKHVAQYLSCCK